MSSKVSSKNKEKKRPKGKVVLKKGQTEKKKTYKDTENSVAGVEPGLHVCKQLLDHCTTLTPTIKKNNFVIFICYLNLV